MITAFSTTAPPPNCLSNPWQYCIQPLFTRRLSSVGLKGLWQIQQRPPQFKKIKSSSSNGRLRMLFLKAFLAPISNAKPYLPHPHGPTERGTARQLKGGHGPYGVTGMNFRRSGLSGYLT